MLEILEYSLCRGSTKWDYYLYYLSYDWNVLVLRRMSMVGDSLSHVALAG